MARNCSVVGVAPMSVQVNRSSISWIAHAKAPSQPAATVNPDHSTRPGEKLKAAMPRMRK